MSTTHEGGEPPESVLKAFGATGAPVRLPGGQGISWRADGIVFKPIEAPDHDGVRWLDQVSPRTQATPIRIALPLRNHGGDVIEQGWTATAWLEGSPPTDEWGLVANTARAFARAFERIDPSELPKRTDRWAVADRAVWGEEEGPLDDHPLARVLRPISLPAQIVHGDLAGNTLMHSQLAPAVIDLSLYARPVEWSVAILAVDAITFADAPVALLDTISNSAWFPQLAARAVLFRMIADVLRGVEPGDTYEAAQSWVNARI